MVQSSNSQVSQVLSHRTLLWETENNHTEPTVPPLTLWMASGKTRMHAHARTCTHMHTHAHWEKQLGQKEKHFL